MRYQVILPPILLVPIFMTTKCNHTSKHQEDVIVTYSNHAEAEPRPSIAEPSPNIAEPSPSAPEPNPSIPERTSKFVEQVPKLVERTKLVETRTEIQIIIPERLITEKNYRMEQSDSDEVIFVPNEREVERNEDYLRHSVVGMDYMGRTVDDVMDNRQVRVETERPADIIFLSGKNNENENTKERKKDAYDTRRSRTDIDKVVLNLNCTNLDCDNTIQSVCGGKIEHKQWRYRLFLNECFFRKVNCYFKVGTNRYHIVSLDKCQNIASHSATRPSLTQLYPPEPVHKLTPVKSQSVKLHNSRRSFSSRRSLSLSVDGRSCSHTCPATCPDDYQPTCAVSGAGQRRVFENHCKLDYNSCAFGIIWRARPLAECIGGKKADMRQSRGFIDWMQRVGIVDNKGRLVLS